MKSFLPPVFLPRPASCLLLAGLLHAPCGASPFREESRAASPSRHVLAPHSFRSSEATPLFRRIHTHPAAKKAALGKSRAIFTSIVENGLRCAHDMKRKSAVLNASADSPGMLARIGKKISVNVTAKPENPSWHHPARLLYRDMFGCLSVCAERIGDAERGLIRSQSLGAPVEKEVVPRSVFEEIIEDRLRSSILAVINPVKIHPDDRKRINQEGYLLDIGGEANLDHSVPAQAIRAIITTTETARTVKDCFPSRVEILVIPEERMRPLTLNVHSYRVSRKGAPDMAFRKATVNVPDFEHVLKRFMSKNTHQRWLLHGIRGYAPSDFMLLPHELADIESAPRSRQPSALSA